MKSQISYTLSKDDVTIQDGEITACSYDFSANSDGTDLTIPSVIGDQTIISIGISIFSDKNITSLVLPTTLQDIGSYSFQDNKISELTIPASVKTIGDYAFNMQNSLRTVTIEDGSQLFYLGQGAIVGNGYLSSITLPTLSISGFTGWMTFLSNNSYNSVSLTNGEYVIDDFTHAHIAVIEQTLTDDDVTVEDGVITSCNNIVGTSIIIPETLNSQTITAIADKGESDDGIFEGQKIIAVNFPETLEDIGEYAFNDNFIFELSFPQSLKKIGKCAFFTNCLEDITIPALVDSIGKSAFNNNNIESVSFEDGSVLSYIGDEAFSTNELEQVEIPSNVKTIGEQAFYMNNLTSVTFAENSHLWHVEQEAFKLNDLSSINLPGLDDENFSGWRDENADDLTESDGAYTITDFDMYYDAKVAYTLTDDDVTYTDDASTEDADDVIFTIKDKELDGTIINIPETLDDKTVSYIYQSNFDSKIILEVNFPSTTKKIGYFRNSRISNLQLPDGLEYLRANAFSNNRIKSIVIPNTVTTIEPKPFNGNDFSTYTLPKSVKENSVFAYWEEYGGETFDAGDEVSVDESGILNAIFDVSTSIKDVEQNNLSIYPNPVTDGILHMDCDGTIHKIEIYDISGSMVKSIIVSSNSNKIDISNLKNGVYFVSTGKTTNKFIKK